MNLISEITRFFYILILIKIKINNMYLPSELSWYGMYGNMK